VSSVAVVAHAGKSVAGGLAELRRELAAAGVVDPTWYEVPKSRKAPKKVRAALDAGADLIFVWGGDGTVQRCIDAVATASDSHGPVPIAIVAAGTANLLASNLGIPVGDVRAAVHVGLHGTRRAIDVGTVNGEHFAVMAGTGFDALMIRDADRGLKDRVGRLAYFWTGAHNLRAATADARVDLDGRHWFEGRVSCVLVGNVGRLTGGLEAFPEARPDDGLLEVGVVTASGFMQWARALTRLAAGRAAESPFVTVGRATRVDVRLGRKLPYELDGGARGAERRLKIRTRPAAITVCVPERSDAR
jgi:YegS/Rv2252/BmrU family lipid kinase